MVVEGYTDVLALHAAGVEEAVGIMGTAVTQEQVAELARGVGADGRVFDGPRRGPLGPGGDAARGADRARARRCSCGWCALPEGRDPADLVQDEGAEAVRERLTQSVSVLEFEVGRVLDDADLDSPEGADRALVAVRELIATRPRGARSATAS